MLGVETLIFLHLYALPQKSEFSLTTTTGSRLCPKGGNGLQSRVAGSATLGDERNLFQPQMRLCLLGTFFSEKATQPRCG